MSMATHDDRSDNKLLLAFAEDGDESAFESLARRHVDMIFAVSLRRSGNRQLAEEATQNVLISLSRQARKLAMRESSISAWLHTGTRFEVSKLQRREVRIKIREQAYATENMNPSTQDEDETFRHLLPVLDQAIDHLRAPDREVIVRRYLQGQDFRSIGKALGISEDAAQKRTTRAFDCLNQFFKRKAGVTVSATAMAVGIGRHCAEAAPAACLQFTAATASTGLATLFTTATLTTMSISKIAAVAAGIVIVGGTITYLATRKEPSSAGASTAQETIANSSPPSSTVTPVAQAGVETANSNIAARDGNITQNANTYSANEELARLEAMSPHPSKDEMRRRLSVRHDRLLQELTADLGLTATQAAGVKAVLDQRLATFRATLELGPHEDDPEQEANRKEIQMIGKAGGIIQGVGLREELAGILSEKQLAAFDEREAQAWQSQIESHAYTEFSKLTPILDLTEDQKDRTFELLQTSSARILEADGRERAFMALQKNQLPTVMDLTHPADMKFITEVFAGPAPLTPGSPEFVQRITEVVGGRIHEQVALLAPVLDARQIQRYRDHLIQQSILNDFGMNLPSPEEP